jgi:APA family basic amino acid/polyamine antiporter
LTADSPTARPVEAFTTASAVAVVVGIVVGIGIFRLPPLVATHAPTEAWYIGFWVAGGCISLLGALCYAELATFSPDSGGEYHFLRRAWGAPVGFLFSWARMTVIQTGSIALAAFILGDFATLLWDLGPWSSSLYAATAVVLLTGLNLWGTAPARTGQNLLAALIVLTVAGLSIAALLGGGAAEPAASGPGAAPQSIVGILFGGGAGMAMIFVLLTYGGWNEAAYLSGELRDVRRNMLRVLLIGIAIITTLYVLINIAYLHTLGLEGLRSSDTVGVALAENVLGEHGSLAVALIVIASALSTCNASIITGARLNYAMGRDFPLLCWLGRWNGRANTPANALLLQGAITLALVGLGTLTKETVVTMVDYLAPVFWFFMILVTLSLFIFRRRHGREAMPFRVPGYPLTPLLFAGACGWLLWSSIAYTGLGATAGIAVLLAGVPLYLLNARMRDAGPAGL